MKRIALMLSASILLASCANQAERAAQIQTRMELDQNIERIRQGCEQMAPGSTEWVLCETMYARVLQDREQAADRLQQQRAAIYRALGDGLKDFGNKAFQPTPVQQNRQLNCTSQDFGGIIHTNCY